MSSKHLPLPPPPSRPEFNEGRKTWWTVALAGIGLLFAFVILSFLTLGFISPLALIGIVFFALVGVQYLVWGWWFEKVYRQGKEKSDE